MPRDSHVRKLVEEVDFAGADRVCRIFHVPSILLVFGIRLLHSLNNVLLCFLSIKVPKARQLKICERPILLSIP